MATDQGPRLPHLAHEPNNVANNGGFGGGAIFNFSNGGTVILTNDTISGNMTTGSGGGIKNFSNLTVTNTIIAGNTASSGNDVSNSGTLTDHGNNLTSDGSLTGGPGDQTGNPTLGPLQDNGGPTPTMAITTASLAFHAGNPTACAGTSSTGSTGTVYTGPTAVDQRGAARVVSNLCSIGAFEPGLVPTQTTLTTSTVSSTYGQPVTLTAILAGVLGGTPGGTENYTFKDGTTTISGCGPLPRPSVVAVTEPSRTAPRPSPAAAASPAWVLPPPAPRAPSPAACTPSASTTPSPVTWSMPRLPRCRTP